MQDKNEQGGGYRACYTNVSKNVSHDLWCFCGCTTQEVHVLLYPETEDSMHTYKPTNLFLFSLIHGHHLFLFLFTFLSLYTFLVVKINV